ncbi:unnamed protein product [Bursaphelenchus okinawaensis]|uniref:LITAF domain-containing protein n=1 Tax=Bursaphelenchus okinawaensis TaxID=465554 RepID=A0A811JQI9_9BILA|nr:unnamed protein product [Bursaphelenchus okinawaensis]CAG9077916.1 unnamed protein product [Bursaphelenchus okinawaensis]
MPQPYKSVPITIHRSQSHTPSMIVNAKKLLSDHPQLIDCPRCKHHGETVMVYKNGMMTWLTFVGICLASVLIIPLFFTWVPFVIDSFRDVEHHCPNCNAWVGTYRRIGRST